MMLPLVFSLNIGGIKCQAQTLTPVRELGQNVGPITQIAFSPLNDTVSVTFIDQRMGWLSVFSRVSNGEPIHELPGLSEPTHTVVFSPDGDGFAWAVGPRLLSLAQSRKPGEKGGAVIQFPTSVAAFSPDGTLLAAAANSVENNQICVRLFDARTGQIKGELKALPLKFSNQDEVTPVTSTVFSSDGKRVVAANLTSVIEWDATTFRLLRQQFHLQSEQIVLSPGGDAAGIIYSEPIGPSDGNELHSRQLWLEVFGEKYRQFDLTLKPGLGDQFEFSGLPAFSADGRFIAAPVWRGGQNSITIWRTSDHKEILRRPTQFEQKSVVFGPEDGQGISLASVYENSINKLQHAVLWRLTLPQ